MVAAKPDCTGQRFNYLTVIQKAEIIKDKSGRSRRLWLLRCDCGKLIKLPRVDFDRASYPQKSCGCKRWNVPRFKARQQLSGKRFGSLVPIAPIPNIRLNTGDRSIVWLCQCDCGERVKKSVKALNSGFGLHCGTRNTFHIPYGLYPPTPSPLPKEVGDLIIKYLYLTKSSYWQSPRFTSVYGGNNSYNLETEDERRDRLIRAAWILVYRKRKGENITELHESRFIKKHLMFCQVDVFRSKQHLI